MHVHRYHPLRRHDGPLRRKLTRSLVFFLSALLFATAIFGFIRDAEAQFQGYSLPNSAGGLNYYGNYDGYGGDRSGGMLNLGIEMMKQGNRAEMQRRQLAIQQRMHRQQLEAQYEWKPQPQWQAQEIQKYRQLQEPRRKAYVPRETWTPEKARASWGMDR